LVSKQPETPVSLIDAIRDGLPEGVELDEREEALLDLAARQAGGPHCCGSFGSSLSPSFSSVTPPNWWRGSTGHGGREASSRCTKGDAVLTVMTLRAISALDEDVRSLDKSAGRLNRLTAVLVVLTVALLVITAVDILG
jgi:hypothetical protein